MHPSVIGGGVTPSSASITGMRYLGEHLGLRVAFEKGNAETRRLKLGAETYSINDGEGEAADERTFHQKEHAFELSNLYFPFAKSSFFLALNVSWIHSQVAFSEHTVDFSLAEPTTTNVEWRDESLAVGLPLGFSKSYSAGRLNILGAIGPKTIVRNKRRFIDDGVNGNVDLAKRDQSLASWDKSKSLGWGLMTMLGYQF